MDRRRFLLLLSAGLVGVAATRGAAGRDDPDPSVAGAPPAPGGLGEGRPAAGPSPAAAQRAVAGAPPAGVVSRLPGSGSSLALTVDDGTDSAVVGALIAVARQTGLRLTFFPNGCYRSWADNARALRPLIESGQVAVGNHTWSHPDLTTLSDADIADQLTRNQAFLRTTLGVRETPFFRPPFGAHDARVDRIAAEVGHPTVVLWYGTLADDRVVTPAQLMTAARQWFLPQHIVIGHANHPAVTAVTDQLVELIHSRRLRTVTLADVWPGR
jgi:peptidoglycan/xylan/chitin deacetylase (PgdA/CDA1 family)